MICNGDRKRGKEREGRDVNEFQVNNIFMNNFNKGNKFLKVVKTKNNYKNLFRF